MACGRRNDDANPVDSIPLIDVLHQAHFVTAFCDCAPNGYLFLWDFLSIQPLKGPNKKSGWGTRTRT